MPAGITGILGMAVFWRSVPSSQNVTTTDYRFRRVNASLETYDRNGRLYRHPRAAGMRWNTYYGAEGGGYGSLTWSEDRPVGRDYPDIGFGYRAIVRKGLTRVLFDGDIERIEEAQDAGDEIEITATGPAAEFNNDVFNKVYSDARPGQWAGCEVEDEPLFQPDKFDYDLNGNIKLRPRRGVDFEAGEYSYVRYTFGFGESPTRIAFAYDLALPESWPGRLEVRDNVGSLWSATTTSRGEHVVAANAGAMWFEVRFYVTLAGENTAKDDTVYGALTSVTVYSAEAENVRADQVMRDLVAVLVDHGLSSDTDLVQDPGHDLPATVAFESDQTPAEVIAWCCKFGGADDALLAWGVDLDERRRVYLEAQDLSAIKYVVRRRSGLSAQVRGDLGESYQVAYGVYTDPNNATRRTEDIGDDEAIALLAGKYRRVAQRLDGAMDEAAALALLRLYLSEHRLPQVSTSFSVSDAVFTPTGKRVMPEDIQAGGIVLVGDFRAREVDLSGNDYRTQWSSFQLVGVEVDYEAGSARLIPAGDRRAFEQILARAAAR